MKDESSPSFCSPPSPKAERRSSGKKDGLGFWFGLLEEPEEGVVLHADFPEDFAAVSAAHSEL